MQFVPWIILFAWLVFLLTWIFLSFKVKKDVNRVWWRSAWLRIVIAFAVALILAKTSASRTTYPSSFFNHVTGNSLLLVLATVFTLVGIGLAVWARLHLGRNWSSSPNMKVGHTLVTSGPYQLIRHPIYTGVLTAILGSALVNSLWFIILAFASFVFVRRVRKEEGYMLNLFPNEYPEYKKHTWALIPYVW